MPGHVGSRNNQQLKIKNVKFKIKQCAGDAWFLSGGARLREPQQAA
jgi:hypothetical protein